LTKRFEEVVRGTAAAVDARFAEAPKGEVTLVVAPGLAATDVEGALAAVGELVAAGAPRGVAAEVVARLSGVARNDLYRGTL
jgi:16S rRNA C1402 (ribose-2'-O) methylase RsmI